MKKIILIVFALAALSCMSCVSALDLDNTTDSLDQQDTQVLEAAIEQDDNATLSKGSDDILESSLQGNSLSSGGDDSTYLVLDNDADREDIFIGDYVTWTVSVENRGPGIAKK